MENTIGQWLVQAGGRIKYSSETPTLDAQILLAKVLEVDRSWIVAHPEYNLRDKQKKLAEDYVQQIEDGIPLPYVLGEWEFYGLRFKVTPQVLIPRSETEILVEEALDWLYRNPQKRRGVDVGTGSGCIAISLAVRMKDLEMVGSDISLGALRRTDLDIAGINNGFQHIVDGEFFFHIKIVDGFEQVEEAIGSGSLVHHEGEFFVF